MVLLYVLGLVIAALLTVVLTPYVKKLAIKIGAVDAPNERKVHVKIMPRLGGLAIFLGFIGGLFVILPAIGQFDMHVVYALALGGLIVVIIGALDDKYQLSPKYKLLGQIVAASVVVSFHIQIDFLNLPFGDNVTVMKWVGIPLTILWIVGVTNAINLIDGLDGLAAGVSGIATATILVLAIIMGNDLTVIVLSAILLGSIGGFLFHNFYPAKIFMGDSGSLFLGFSLATLSILGFKQATVVSFLLPLLVLGVPLSDTFFAIVRRIVNRVPISKPDKSHLHHCLTELGFSHRTTVLMIYGISAAFGALAILLSHASLWLTILSVVGLLLIIGLGAEAIGIISKGKKPLLGLFYRLRSNMNSK